MGNHSSIQLNTGCIFYRLLAHDFYFVLLWHPMTAALFRNTIEETACFSHLKFRGSFCSLTDDPFWYEYCRCCWQVTVTRNNNSACVFVSHFRTDRCTSSHDILYSLSMDVRPAFSADST